MWIFFRPVFASKIEDKSATGSQFWRDFAAILLDFFAALRSFGVIVGCFFASLVGLRSLDILLLPHVCLLRSQSVTLQQYDEVLQRLDPRAFRLGAPYL